MGFYRSNCENSRCSQSGSLHFSHDQRHGVTARSSTAAAAFAPPGLPNAPIGRGSVFTVFGESLGPAAGQTVVILRDVAATQELDLIASGAFAAENVEVQLDRLAAAMQTLRELASRSPRMGVGTNLADLALLSQGLLKGNNLTNFINRSVEMMA